MATTVEKLVAINAIYTSALRKARTYPRVGHNGASGIKRDAAIAKAEREYYDALRKLGITSRKRHVPAKPRFARA